MPHAAPNLDRHSLHDALPISGPAKSAKAAKAGKGSKQAVLTQDGAPQLSAEQIVANSDSNIDRIKTELKLTPEQEKHWTGRSEEHTSELQSLTNLVCRLLLEI